MKITTLFEILCLSSLRAKIKKNQSKMVELEWSQEFPIITLWELSVAMETRDLILSGPKVIQPIPHPNDATNEI